MEAEYSAPSGIIMALGQKAAYLADVRFSFSI
jgi:hypothetical protein